MFAGLLWKKPQPTPDASQAPSTADGASPNIAPRQLRTPSPSELALDPATASATKPSSAHSPERDIEIPDTATTPNPALAAIDPEADPEGAVKVLLDILPTIPAKTLYTYTTTRLDHLLSTLSDPPLPDSTTPPQRLSSSQVPALISFFSALSPPPQLHCVRCHKDYVEVENDDRSCLVAHDDESAEVERVGRTRVIGETGAEYVTMWNCCGKMVEGDGDQGPPDGWCYEGKHTTDIKRARFRADSTPQDDKLVSCLRRNCHNVRSQLPRSRSARATNSKKRPRYVEEDEDDEDDEDEGDEDSGLEEIVGGVKGLSTPGGKAKGKGPARKKGATASVEGSVNKRARLSKNADKPLSSAKTKAKSDGDVEMEGVEGQDSAEIQLPSKPAPKPRGRPRKKPLVEQAQTDVDEPVPATDAETPQAKAKKPRAKPGPKPKSKAAASGVTSGTETAGASSSKTSPKSAKPRSKRAARKEDEEDDGNEADESMMVDGEDDPAAGAALEKKHKDNPKMVVQMRAKAKVAKKAQGDGSG